MEVKRKKCQVIMLPTKNKSDIAISIHDNLLYHKNDFGFDYFSNQGTFETQQLYIISNDEIKEGDWFYLSPHIINKGGELELPLDGGIYQRKTSKKSPELFLDKGYINGVEDGYIQNSELIYCKKIIATTDKSLKPKCDCSESEAIYCGSKCQKPLPSPSKAFIEKYCKVNGIDEVMVEYERVNVVILDDNLIKQINSSTSMLDYPVDRVEYKLKVNSHNEITIHPIKDNFTRDEVLGFGWWLTENFKEFKTKDIPELLNKYENL